jgi:hypothetical protein
MTGTYEREGGRDLYNPMEWLCPFPIHLSIYLFNLSNRSRFKLLNSEPPNP